MKKIILLLLICTAFNAWASDKPAFADKQEALAKQLVGRPYFEKLSSAELKQLHQYADAKLEYFYYLNEGGDVKRGIEALRTSYDIYSQSQNMINLNRSILFVEIILAQSLTKACGEEIENLYSNFMLAIESSIKERDAKKSKLPVMKPKGN